MTDRGIPSADGAVACPFVAFEDDRDSRSTAPDHRHRCFAEPVPAPRAIAHQDAYCLSPAFAVCPAFQDWARREAAAARPTAPAQTAPSRPREDDTSGPLPMPPVEREPRHAPASAAQPIPARKPAPRDWAAPPPWMGDPNADADEADAPDGPGLPAAGAAGAIPGWNAGSAAGSIAGAAAAGGAPAPRAWADGDARADSRGLANSAAARLAGPDPDLPAPARPIPSWADAPQDDDDDDAYSDAAPPLRPQPPLGRSVSSRTPVAAQPSRPAPAPRSPAGRDAGRPALKDAQELFGPAWERPRRYEAYPSLRTRVGLPSFGRIPPLGIAAGALVIAALFLFFVSPMILGLGKHATTDSSAPPSGAASAAPTDTPVPTVPPAPTAFTYTVVQGDTLSGIAQKFGVSVKAILNANKQIKNQNSIKIGDVLTIPPKGTVTSGGVSGASPSAVSGASASPSQ